MKPLVLERLGLRGALYPLEVTPGGTLTVRAWTLGGATSVTALWPDGAATPLTPGGDPARDANEWLLVRRLPAGTPEGTHRVRLVARYRAATRSVTLSYRVVVPFALQPRSCPTPPFAARR